MNRELAVWPNEGRTDRRKTSQPQDWRGILKLRAKMKLYLLLAGFITVWYELSASSGLRNRKAALTNVNKAPKRLVKGDCRIIQDNASRGDSTNDLLNWLEPDPNKSHNACQVFLQNTDTSIKYQLE
ncbi:MAG: hypothetical protein ACYSSN_10105 [Planctomycetota bacterium]